MRATREESRSYLGSSLDAITRDPASPVMDNPAATRTPSLLSRGAATESRCACVADAGLLASM